MLSVANKLAQESAPKSRFKPEMFKDVNGSYAKDAIRAFLCETEMKSKSSPFSIKNGELWYSRPRVSWKGGFHKTGKYHTDIIAKKVNGEFFGNSSGLAKQAVRSSTANQLNVQEEISRFIPMVPFVLFEETGFKLESLKIIDRGPEEELDLNQKDRNGNKVFQHYTGAMLFNIGPQQFLFDIDRVDLAQNNFNAFMSRLPKKCKTIKEAYDSLKPKEVLDAERFMKKPCPRHGEWFFIPVHGKRIPPLVAELDANGRPINAVLQSKGNRPHYAEKKCGDYVTGKVRHGGFEHKDLMLDGWHKPVPNTAVESFKITGAID